MSLLLPVSDFCAWSGMRIKLEKSVIKGFNYQKRVPFPTESILFKGEPLTGLAAEAAFAYLGVRARLVSPSPPATQAKQLIKVHSALLGSRESAHNGSNR